MRFDCARCGAKDAIALPLDGSPNVVCPSCRQRQPRHEYELKRIQLQLARGLARAAEADRLATQAAAQAALEAAGPCPSCGNDLWVAEFGCEKCGHGRKGFFTRHRGVGLALFFLGLAGLGAGAVAAVDRFLPPGPIVNLLIVLGGAGLSTFGVHAIQRPTSLQLVDNQGTDAFGHHRWGNPRQATREQGVLIGAICMVVGLVIMALGVFIGSM